MKKRYLIGIDAGTTLIKVGIYDQTGKCTAKSEQIAPEDKPKTGMYIQSGELYYEIVLKLIKESLEKSGINRNRVEAIGFSGQMGGAIGVDENWFPVTEWSNALDARYLPHTAKMLDMCRDEILKSSGTNYPFFAPKIMWWKNEYPEIFKKVRKFMILANYIAGRMSDAPIDSAFMDQTYMQMTGIADIPNTQWNTEICQACDIDIHKLPAIINSTDVIGSLNKEVARFCELPAGIPLVAGAGDKPAGFLAAGMIKPGAVIDEAGSFSAFSVCTDRFVPDEKNRTLEILPSAISGLYYPTLILIGSGTAHRWVTDLFSSGSEKSIMGTSENRFAYFEHLASELPPGSENLLAIGLLNGSGYPFEPDIRGVWAGFSLHHRPEHFYKAILESYAFEYSKALTIMKATYPELPFREIQLTGGGSKSGLWNHIKSDVLGCSLSKLSRTDLTLLGDIILAGNAVGIFPDVVSTVEEFTTNKEKILPDNIRNQQYVNFIKLYRSLTEKLRPFFKELKVNV